MEVKGFSDSFDKRLSNWIHTTGGDFVYAVNNIRVRNVAEMKLLFAQKNMVRLPIKLTIRRRRRGGGGGTRDEKAEKLTTIFERIPLGLTLSETGQIVGFQRPAWSIQRMGDYVNIGDYLLSVAGHTMTSLADLTRILKRSKPPFSVIFDTYSRTRIPREGWLNRTSNRYHCIFPTLPLGIRLSNHDMRVMSCTRTTTTSEKEIGRPRNRGRVPQLGDQLVALAGRSVRSMDDLRRAIRSHKSTTGGDSFVPIAGTFIEADRMYTLEFRAGRPLGLTMTNVNLKITRIIAESVSSHAAAKVRIGDRVVALNGKAVTSTADLRERILRIEENADCDRDGSGRVFELTFAVRRERRAVTQDDNDVVEVKNGDDTNDIRRKPIASTPSSSSEEETLTTFENDDDDNDDDDDDDDDDATTTIHTTTANTTTIGETSKIDRVSSLLMTKARDDEDEESIRHLRGKRAHDLSSHLLGLLLENERSDGRKVGVDATTTPGKNKDLFHDEPVLTAESRNAASKTSKNVVLDQVDAMRDLKYRISLAPDISSEIEKFVAIVRSNMRGPVDDAAFNIDSVRWTEQMTKSGDDKEVLFLIHVDTQESGFYVRRKYRDFARMHVLLCKELAGALEDLRRTRVKLRATCNNSCTICGADHDRHSRECLVCLRSFCGTCKHKEMIHRSTRRWIAACFPNYKRVLDLVLEYFVSDRHVSFGSLLNDERRKKEDEEDEECDNDGEASFRTGRNMAMRRSSWQAGLIVSEIAISSNEAPSRQLFRLRERLVTIMRQHEAWIGPPSMFFQPAPNHIVDDLDDTLDELLSRRLYADLMAVCTRTHAGADEKLATRLRELSWMEPKHLEIKLMPSDLIMAVAQRELREVSKVKSSKRKMSCVVRSYGQIVRALQMGTEPGSSTVPGADDLFPLFVLIVLRAKVPNLFANIEFVQEYCTPEGLSGEAAYCLCHLQGAATFLMTLSAKELVCIDEREFQKRVGCVS
eukprot:g4169.t1